MKVLWICGLPEEVRKVHPVTDVPSATWSWILGHLPPPKDVELHIICPVFGMKDMEAHFDYGEAHWHCFRLKKFEPLFLRYRFYWSIRGFVKDLSPDIVHGWGGESGCGLLATYCSKHSVVGVQGALQMLCSNARRWHIHVPENGSVSAWFRRRMERLTYRRASRLLVESESASDALVEYYGLTSEIVPHPLRSEFLNHEICETHENATRFLFVGQLTARKGAMDVLRAFALIEDKSARMTMVGCGDLDNVVRGFIRESGLRERVERVSYCSADRLCALMDASDAIVVPSYGDTGPTVLKEALARGLYPIVYDNTGARELVERYRHGQMVETGNLELLVAAMQDVSRRKNCDVAERIRCDLSRESVWNELKSVYGDAKSPVKFILQKRSSPAICQRVSHLRKMCAGLAPAKKEIVVSCCTGIRQNLRTVLCAKMRGCKVIREINEWPLSVVWRRSIFKQWFEIYVLPKLFDGFVCISDCLVDFCRTHGRRGAKIFKLPMTVDVEEVERSADTSGGNSDYVCYAGSLSDVKDGVDTLKCACKGVDLKILCGMPRREALRIMARARCLVLARPDSLQARAGFPTKLGEYLALGRPVVVTKVGEIPRYLTDGKTAFFAEPGSAKGIKGKIEEVFSDRVRAERIGAAGKIAAKQLFDWRNHRKEISEWMMSFT